VTSGGLSPKATGQIMREALAQLHFYTTARPTRHCQRKEQHPTVNTHPSTTCALTAQRHRNDISRHPCARCRGLCVERKCNFLLFVLPMVCRPAHSTRALVTAASAPMRNEFPPLSCVYVMKVPKCLQVRTRGLLAVRKQRRSYDPAPAVTGSWAK